MQKIDGQKIFTTAKIIYNEFTVKRQEALRRTPSLSIIFGMKFAYKYLEDEKMQTVQDINYQKQIDEALKRAKYKKALYIYDDSGHKRLLGVFSKKTASQVKKYLRSQNLINRLTEYDIKTTEPDSQFI